MIYKNLAINTLKAKNNKLLYRFKDISCFWLISIFGFILTIFFYSCQVRQIANVDSKGKNIICFGDSLTFGYNAGTQNSYPNVLSKILGREVINAGKNGDTVATALNRLKKDVLENDPLLVIVILGANDFLQGIPKKQTLDNLEIIIRRIKSKGAMVALGQIGPFKMYDYKEDYKRLANAEDVLLIRDILGGIFGHPDLMSDSIHPNSKGYVEMAEKVYKAIAPILKQNKKIRSNETQTYRTK
ncbi:MAG: arylesterase [Candidatus Omnitrophica bacterium]|nr:arylesterase [Candidatus Omnitrophota bacterium]